MKHRYYLFLAWLHEYFHHPLPNIRSARVIVPRRLYSNFGNVCVAVPHSHEEKCALVKWPSRALPPTLLHQALHAPNPIAEIDNLYTLHIENVDVPSYCNLCDFYRYAIPCPFYNVLRNGQPVCNTHKYIIIRHQT